MPNEERFHLRMPDDPKAVNNSGSDSVPDMDSYISSDVNEDELNAQVQHVRQGSAQLKKDDMMKPEERDAQVVGALKANAAERIDSIKETDPGDRERVAIPQPAVVELDESDPIPDMSGSRERPDRRGSEAQGVLDKPESRCVSDGDEVRI